MHRLKPVIACCLQLVAVCLFLGFPSTGNAVSCPPGTPDLYLVTADQNCGITFNWTDAGTGSVIYRLRYIDNNNVDQILRVLQDAFSCTVPRREINADGNVTFYVQGCILGCCKNDPHSSWPLPARGIPPASLTATQGDAGTVRLDWTHMAGNTNVRLYRNSEPTPFAQRSSSSLTYTFTETVCATNTYKVSGVTSTGCESFTTNASSLPPLPTPAPPGNLTATGLGCDVSLSWPSVPAAQNYRVYRDQTLVHDTSQDANKLSWLDDNSPLSAQTYCVTAYNVCGESGTSPCRPRPAPTAIAAPATLTASDTEESIELDWAPVSGALGYRLYRDSESNYFLQVLAPTTHATDVIVGEHQYCVTAYDECRESGRTAVCDLGHGLSPSWSNAGYVWTGSRDAGAAYDSKRKRMLVFGGRDNSCGFMNSVWVKPMPPASADWSSMSPITCSGSAPSPRSGSAVIYAPNRDALICYGGVQGGTFNGPLWQLSFTGYPAPRWCELNATGTAPLSVGMRGAYDSLRDRLIIVSPGQGVYALSLTSLVWSQIWSGSMTSFIGQGFDCVYDPAGDRIIVRGGCAEAFYNGCVAISEEPCHTEVSALPLTVPNPRWTVLATSGPAAILFATMTYDSKRQRVLLYGGRPCCDLPTLDEVWELRLVATPTWHRLATLGSPPGGRWHHTAVYSIHSDRLAVLGGEGQGDPWGRGSWFLSWPDLVPPGAVTDLSPDFVGQNEFGVFWTAPGDDGSVGTANSYDLRIATFDITEQNFESATPVSDPPSPAAAGTPQSYSFTGLFACTQYRVALKTCDESGWSPLSNVITVSTMCSGGGGGGGPCLDPRPCPIASPIESATSLPQATELSSSNPVRGPGVVRYGIPASHAGRPFDVSVFDLAGARARTLAQGTASPGRFVASWDLRSDTGDRARPGVYFIRFRIGAESLRRSVVVVQ
jgi:hypothetical protein